MLPEFSLNITSTMRSDPVEGAMQYQYRPFYNLHNRNPKAGEKPLEKLRIKVANSGIDIKSAVDLSVEESYDGSSNIIINDRSNAPKLINSRFYLTDSTRYKIGDRKGNVDTNIYTEENFVSETSLVKTVNSLVKVEFEGLSEGGKMPVGNYTFYFKLADSDGNESDFIAESGRIVAHIGNINRPHHIRGGQVNEDSGKTINLILKDLDLAYTYINVYYTRTTGTSELSETVVSKIVGNFKIKGLDTPINITGYEEHSDISIDEINTQYTNFDDVKSITNCQNITFAGNVSKNYDLFRVLENLSLYITPEIVNDETIGELDEEYNDRFDRVNGFEYYNTKNIYSKLGYWDEEIYRFGIVYVLNDYTLTPVFNIRGTKELTPDIVWQDRLLYGQNIANKNFNIQDDYIIEGTSGLENSKGVVKIKHSKVEGKTNDIFGNVDGIKPIGIRFKFNSNVVNSLGGLGELTKGFFIVRQPRIPTILAQSVGISTTKHGNLPLIKGKDSYLMESFLSHDIKKKPYLGRSLINLKDSDITKNALLCPEADLRTEIFNSYFNSSAYSLKEWNYQPVNKYFSRVKNTDQYSLGTLKPASTNNTFNTDISLLLIEPEISLIKNRDQKFSSLAGSPIMPENAIDVIYGDYNDPKVNIQSIDNYNYSASKVRGVFNTYIGTNSDNIKQGTYYNIYQQGYDFETYWKDYFKIRFNDYTAYHPIGDRTLWGDLQSSTDRTKMTESLYRGDCYINTFTHRVNWNFTDPELPTSDQIVDKYTWYKNWRVSNKASTVITLEGEEETSLQYNKLMPLFTYKSKTISLGNEGELEGEPDKGIIESGSKRFKKYSEFNGVFGFDKLNRPDINAVDLGHWVTFKVCSNINLAMRDVEHDNPSEEALHGMKRSFYPLQDLERKVKLPESRAINKGISKTGGDRRYYDLGNIPFIKDSFTTRIHYSNVLQQSTFVNGNRVFMTKNYQDYSIEYGEITKLVEWYGTLIAIMEHGVLMIPVNERAMMKNETGDNVYINTENVLPKNPRVLSDSFGTIWPDSVVKTAKFIYGLDTVGKKVWRTDGKTFEIISDLSVQQFLNENINIKSSDKNTPEYRIHIKSHYNAFKQDVHFVYQSKGKKWHLCWNELLGKWVTRYSWYPEFSENINNIFYTFADTIEHKKSKGLLFKHGFAGTREEKGIIKPTQWYGEQHPFEFEFVVADAQGLQKIYNNMQIISNKVEPNSIIYELPGDGFDWHEQKDVIVDLSDLKGDDDEDMNKGFGTPFYKIF